VGGESVRLGIRVRRMAFGRRADGTVVSQRERPARRGNRSLVFPVIEFSVNGEAVTFTDRVAARKWAIGRECAVAYSPEDPARTAVAIRPANVAGLLITATFSLALFFGAFWLLGE